MRVVAANNDAQVRVFDVQNFACLNQFSFDWSVNVSTLYKNRYLWCQSVFSIFPMFAYFVNGSWQNTSVSPDSKLVAVLGDSADCLIADAQSGKVSRFIFLLPIYFVLSKPHEVF